MELAPHVTMSASTRRISRPMRVRFVRADDRPRDHRVFVAFDGALSGSGLCQRDAVDPQETGAAHQRRRVAAERFCQQCDADRERQQVDERQTP